ncbi:MFS transporter [Microbacterium capsulatum]|uniref:MFS transporter n=1 Tax=Microbacterium capsulatum TaxID=3041921 RepID=A0ABU0XLL5_9MICO|nr:MFS transporter [Microbacterium sp. ASV81]MDQ4215010.1 MFS transporter [Microbacterium sp. ASV81]
MRTRDDERVYRPGALMWLAVATFSMGIDGYVLAGLLPRIATDLQVDAAAAGQLMSVFAATGAIAGPVLGALTGRWERKTTIVLALSVFVLGNLLVGLAPTYFWAMTGRVVSALGGALLNAVIGSYVIARTPEEYRGRALSLVMGGFLFATALGAPVGLVIGQADWRIPLFLVVGVGIAALAGILVKVPTLRLPPLPLRRALSPLTQPAILVVLLVPMGLMCASYLCFTYATLIIGPRVGVGYAMIAVLFGYGIVSLFGNIVSGRMTDRRGPVGVLTVIVATVLAGAVLGWAGLLLPGIAGAVAAIVWFLVCAFFNGGSGVAAQARLAGMVPESVAALVLALNNSAMMLGSALGSALGGLALVSGAQPDQLLLVSAAVLAVTLAGHLLAVRSAGRKSRTVVEVSLEAA